MSRVDPALVRKGGLVVGTLLAFALLTGFHSVVTSAVERGAMKPADGSVVVVAATGPARTR